MSIVSYIVIALALGLSNMLLFYRCSEAKSIRLSSGILKVLLVAIIHVVLYYLGEMLGSILSFNSPSEPELYKDINTYIFLGLTTVVAIKMFTPYLRREPRLPVFDLSDFRSVLAMAVATGINTLLLGIGTGFVKQVGSSSAIIWILLITCTLLGTIGLMFGRQKVSIRPRRWMAVSCLLLLGVAVSAIISL